MNPESFYNHYRDNGFVFSDSILTRYCLSLYTKPFVILSGISGTGKTKIAQLFNTLEENTVQINEDAEAAATSLGQRIILNVTQGVLEGDRGNFRIADLGVLFEADEMNEINTNIETFRQQGNGGNIIPPERMIIEGENGEELIIAVYLQRASSPLVRVRFKSKRGEGEEFDSSIYMRDHYRLNQVLELEKISRRRFRIASVDQTEIVRISDQMEAREASLVDNSLFISVKSNWTDSTELFGHYNMLSDKYQMTELLRFILRAQDFPGKPFFLILDEMNLSKVEHYFSDFLSCLESRYLQNGNVKQEAISLHNFSTAIDSDDELFDAIPNKVELPRNLYVTGTVNIDETTYMFSPKVLDRANVIEFNEVSLDNYGVQAVDIESFRFTDFPTFGSTDVATMSAFNEAPDEFKRLTRELLDILGQYNLHFGYRVINEMGLYMKNVTQFIGNSDVVIHQGIDSQISQKILPKLSGAYGKLEEPLRKLIALLCSESFNFNEISLDKLDDINISNSKYSESLKKLISMYKGLMKNGFTSYLE